MHVERGLGQFMINKSQYTQQLHIVRHKQLSNEMRKFVVHLLFVRLALISRALFLRFTFIFVSLPFQSSKGHTTSVHGISFRNTLNENSLSFASIIKLNCIRNLVILLTSVRLFALCSIFRFKYSRFETVWAWRFDSVRAQTQTISHLSIANGKIRPTVSQKRQ